MAARAERLWYDNCVLHAKFPAGSY